MEDEDLVYFICDTCGKEGILENYYIQISEYPDRHDIFCSRKCLKDWVDEFV